MSLRTWLYHVRNYRAHLRALRLGHVRVVGNVGYAGELRGDIIRMEPTARVVPQSSVLDMWHNWCAERCADVGFAESPDHARAILGGLGLLPTRRYALGVLSRRVVTDAGVAFMADDFFDASQEITSFDFHDSGTGTTAEAVTDVDLVTPAGPTTRATGTASNPTAPVYRTIGTISYTSTLAITEHGLFADATRGAPDTLWDRSVFSAINVVNGDSIQFTMSLTITAGG